jgi:hypothetical protein
MTTATTSAGALPDRRRRARLLAVCAVVATIGAASKYYTGSGRGVVVGQFEDFFGTIFLILFLRVFVLRAALWKVAGAIVAIVVAIELSQLLHGGWIERARATWLGMRILGAYFEWADLLAYALAAGAAVWIDRRLARPA